MNKDHRWTRHGPAPVPESLPRASPPARAELIGSDQVSLRVFLHSDAWDAIRRMFAPLPEGRERIGLLLGQALQDDRGPFIVIEGVVAAPHTKTTSGGETFTERSWDALQSAVDGRRPRPLVVGSFRIRPGGGTSLTPYDQFSVSRFFPEWHHLLYIVDPARHRQGMFHWREGRLHPLPGFWVSEESAAAQGLDPATPAVKSHPLAAPPTQSGPARRRSLSAVGLLLLLALLPLACVGRLPGSLPAVRKQIDDAEATGQRLMSEAEQLRQKRDELERWLEEVESSASTGSGVRTSAPLSNSGRGISGPVGTGDGTSTAPSPLAEAGPQTRAPGNGPPLSANGLPPSGNGFGAPRRYVVRQGDTLWSISSRLLGDPFAYRDLAEGNDISDPNLILPGWELHLPDPQ